MRSLILSAALLSTALLVGCKGGMIDPDDEDESGQPYHGDYRLATVDGEELPLVLLVHQASEAGGNCVRWELYFIEPLFEGEQAATSGLTLGQGFLDLILWLKSVQGTESVSADGVRSCTGDGQEAMQAAWTGSFDRTGNTISVSDLVIQEPQEQFPDLSGTIDDNGKVVLQFNDEFLSQYFQRQVPGGPTATSGQEWAFEFEQTCGPEEGC